MSKKDQVSDAMLLADALLRLKAMEGLLVRKGFFTVEEYHKEMEDVTAAIAKKLLEQVGVGGDLDQIIKDIQDTTSNKN